MVSNMKGLDFYGILGVKKDADDKTLKTAYRKLALKYHPDKKSGDEKKFKDIAEAYSVLSDKEKRIVYDQLGEEGLKAGVSAEDAKKYGAGGFAGGMPGSGGGGGFEMPPEFAENLFSQFFGGGGGHGMGGMGSRSGMGGNPAGFSTFSTGGGMGGGMGGGFGMGMNPNEGFGQQHQQQAQRKRPAKQITQPFQVALDDLVEGISKKLKITRKVLDPRTGQVDQVEKIVQLPVKPGMKSGARFTFKGLGNDVDPSQEPDDFVFVLGYKPHDKFVRDGNDLVTSVDITLKQALEGGTVAVPTLGGRTIRVPFGPMNSSASSTIIPESGLPDAKTGKKGCLQVKFNVLFPKQDTSERERLANVL